MRYVLGFLRQLAAGFAEFAEWCPAVRGETRAAGTEGLHHDVGLSESYGVRNQYDPGAMHKYGVRAP